MKEYLWIIVGFVLMIIGCFVVRWNLIAAAWLEGFGLMAFQASETETY